MTLIEHQRSQLVREEYKLSYLAKTDGRLYQKYVDFLVARGHAGESAGGRRIEPGALT